MLTTSESMGSQTEFYDAEENLNTSSDDSEVCSFIEYTVV